MFRSWKQLIALFVLTGAPALAVPPGFNVQGRLTDAGGVNRDGVFALKFSIFDSATGGANLWTRTYPSVTVRNGNFQLILTDPADNPSQILADSFGADSRHLEIQVLSGPGVSAPEAPLVPRQQLVSVPFALKTGALTSPDTAITAKIAGIEYLRINTNGNIGIGTTNPRSLLHSTGEVRISQPDSTAGSTPRLQFATSGGSVNRAYIQSDLDVTGSLTLQAEGNQPIKLNPQGGSVGIGTAGPVGKLDIVGSGAGTQLLSLRDLLGGSFGIDLQGVGLRSRAAFKRSGGGAPSIEVMSIPLNGATGGNVGIGTTSPGQKLTVAGTIESTSGGFKFPDGTTQVTAVSAGGDSFVSGITLSAGVPSVTLALPGIGPGDNIRIKWALLQLGSAGDMQMRFNGDGGNNYQTGSHFVDSRGVSGAQSGINETRCYMGRTNGASVAADMMSVGEYNVMVNPNNSKQAQGSYHADYSITPTIATSMRGGCFYSGPSAITSVTILTSAGTFKGKMKIDKIQ